MKTSAGYKIIYPGWCKIMTSNTWRGEHIKVLIIVSELENELKFFYWYFFVFSKFCFVFSVNKYYIIFSKQCLQKHIHVAAQSWLGLLAKHKLICVHFFIQQISTEFLLWARHYARTEGYSSKQRKVWHIAAYIQVGETDDK